MSHRFESGSFSSEPNLTGTTVPKRRQAEPPSPTSEPDGVGLTSKLTRSKRQGSDPLTNARTRFVHSSGDVERPDTAPAQVGPEAIPPDIPGYRILEELGRGGMGVVYRAFQFSLEREVALKCLLPGIASSADGLHLRAEASTLATISHPNIVQVFSVGEYQGIPYFSMEYVGGGTLEDSLDEFSQSPNESAALVEQLARAVHVAHEQGVVHCDLKPSNVLLGDESVPKISDFGIARRIDHSTSLTRTGLVIGTPQYMAPEQARGQRGLVSPSTDVYSLGAILYELLTGKPLFEELDDHEILEALANRAVPSIAKQNPHCPKDLETVCLQCLELEPQRRYPSTLALADDLRRAIDGQPIEARPIGVVERTWRWAKRHPGSSSLLGLLFFVVLFSFAMISWKWNEASRLAHQEQTAKQDALQTLAQNRQLQNEAREQSARALFDLALDQCRRANSQRGLHLMVRALRLAEESGNRALCVLIRKNVDGWQARLFPRIEGIRHRDWILQVGFTPDGQTVVTSSRDKTVRLWNRVDGTALGEPLLHRYAVHDFCFTPDGSTLITAAGTLTGEKGEIRFWDWKTGTPARDPITTDRSALSVSIDSGGRTLLTFHPTGKGALWYGLGKARLWDLTTGESLSQPFPAGQGAFQALFTPGGGEVLTAEMGQIRRWDPRTGTSTLPALRVAVPNGKPNRVPLVVALSIDPAGQTLASGQVFVPVPSGAPTGDVRLWDLATGDSKHEPLPMRGLPKVLAFSPEGRKLAVGAYRPTVDAQNRNALMGDALIWSTTTGTPLCQALEHDRPIRDLEFSKDGSFLLTTGENGALNFWHSSSGTRARTPIFTRGTNGSLAVSPDGKYCVAGAMTNDPAATLCRLPRIDQQEIPLTIEDSPAGVGIDPRTSRFVLVDGQGTIHAGQLPTGEILSRSEPHPHWRTWYDVSTWSFWVEISKRLDRCWFRLEGDSIQVWDVVGDEPIGPALPHKTPLRAAELSDDGRFMLSSESSGLVLWRDCSNGATLQSWRVNANVLGASISPDNEWVALGLEKAGVRLLSTKSKQTRLVLSSHDDHEVLRFSPDGSTLLAVSRAGVARMWDVPSGQRKGRDLTLPSKVVRLAFAPDARTVAFACRDGQVLLYDGQLRYLIGPPLPHPSAARTLLFAENGTKLYTCADDKILRIWTLPRAGAEPVAEVLRHVERVTSQRMNEHGELVSLRSAVK